MAMVVRVVIVDDSAFFRQRIADLIQHDDRIEVIGTAANGREGVEQVKKLKPDVVTMDVEMPQLNGIEAVRVIMRECPTKVLMLSSLTQEGARVTLQALEAGAVDYLSKDMRAWMDRSQSLQTQLTDKLVMIARQGRAISPFGRRIINSESSSVSMVFGSSGRSSLPQSFERRSSKQKVDRERLYRTDVVKEYQPSKVAPRSFALRSSEAEIDNSVFAATGRHHSIKVPRDTKLVVIGSSTGGPAALQEILTQLPASFPYPILLIQHMPKTFTSVFAERLNQQCDISVKEAEDGDRLLPGHALLAPGGHQLIIDPKVHDKVSILPGDERLTYKPSVDVTYGSAARTFGSRVLALILTGMGADGADGARLLKQSGATIWAQSKDSCTIFGMPQAVIKAGYADEVLDLGQFGPILSGPC